MPLKIMKGMKRMSLMIKERMIKERNRKLLTWAWMVMMKGRDLKLLILIDLPRIINGNYSLNFNKFKK